MYANYCDHWCVYWEHDAAKSILATRKNQLCARNKGAT